MTGYQAAREFARPIWDRRTTNFNLYIGKTEKKTKNEPSYHVPYISTLLNNVWPLLAARMPTGTVIATNKERDGRAARLGDELIKDAFRLNNFDYTFMMGQKEAMLFDSHWAKVCWEYQDSSRDYASIVPLDTFSVLPHPRKIQLDDRWPIFIRTEMTKAEMILRGWDKTRINKLGKSKLQNEQYRRQRMQSLGMTTRQYEENVRDEDDLYEVIEVWGSMNLKAVGESDFTEGIGYLVIANEEAIINTDAYQGQRRFESPYKHGKIPLAHLPYEPIPHMLLGESFIDPVADMQRELNFLEKQKAMNYKRRNEPPMKVRRKGKVDLSKLKYINSLPWLVDELDDIEPFILPDLAPSIDAQQDMIRRNMQQRTGANDILLVTDDVAVQGGNTATGAAIANENTKTRFRPQARLIDEYVQRIGELMLSMYQDTRFFDREKAIAVADEEGNFYEELVGPGDLRGNLRFTVNASSSLAESNAQKLEKFVNIKAMYAEDPAFNHEYIDGLIFEAADLDPTKAKRGRQDMLPELTMKLQQLVAVTQRPGFANAPQAQKDNILASIAQLKQMIEQLSGGQGEQQAVDPQMMAPEQSQTTEVPV